MDDEMYYLDEGLFANPLDCEEVNGEGHFEYKVGPVLCPNEGCAFRQFGHRLGGGEVIPWNTPRELRESKLLRNSSHRSVESVPRISIDEYQQLRDEINRYAPKGHKPCQTPKFFSPLKIYVNKLPWADFLWPSLVGGMLVVSERVRNRLLSERITGIQSISRVEFECSTRVSVAIPKYWCLDVERAGTGGLSSCRKDCAFFSTVGDREFSCGLECKSRGYIEDKGLSVSQLSTDLDLFTAVGTNYHIVTRRVAELIEREGFTNVQLKRFQIIDDSQ